MAQSYSNSTDRLLAELPAERALRASRRAWELFQADRTGYLSLYDATVQAVAELRAEPAPKPLGERIAAARRVVTVESASTPGVVYQVVDGVCSCTAARFGRQCWHVKAARQQQRAAA